MPSNDMQMPTSPPPLHTRSTNEMYETPTTPTRHGFTTPQQTPMGSPSKTQVPPGAYDLPNVFENAMKLLPTFGTPSRNGQQMPGSPGKTHAYGGHEENDDGVYPAYQNADMGQMPGSPTRKSNKENTPPGPRPGLKKEPSFINQAAKSREDVYKTREADTQSAYKTQGLSREDLDKLQKPSVKRLANVTQLCM